MLQLRPEIWTKIAGFEEYKISSFGRVQCKDGSIMKPHLKRGGYLGVNLRKSGNLYGFTIHRLVAKNFAIKGIGHIINHIDENRHNNNILNLEWSNQSKNVLHSYYKHNTRKTVYQYDKNNILIKRWDSIIDAVKSTGIIRQNISQCIKNKRSTAGGYIWKT